MATERGITIAPALTDADVATIRELFLEYAASIKVDLSYQHFQQEIASLPGDYAPPGGVLLLARGGDRAIGCVGVRLLGDGVCELKRLYVRRDGRGTGLGRELTEAAIAFGRSRGYRAMRLDTLSTMAAAQALYRSLGFREIAPYRVSPIGCDTFMELPLSFATPETTR